MKKNKIIITLSILTALMIGLFVFPKSDAFFGSAFGNGISATGNKPSDVQILQKWELPDILREVSGIAYLGDNRFACVQDEEGTIFIYNTQTAKIEKQIPFAGPGDYEGITLVGETAYIVRSDGRLYEVQNFMNDQPKVAEFTNHLTGDHNVEGLCFDKNQNRLLLAIKGSEPNADDFKGIYAFNLATKSLEKDAVFKLNLKDPAFGKVKGKKLKSALSPSEIAVHPQTGHIYITDAVKQKIVVLEPGGQISKVYPVTKADFAQPEGIAFTPQGDLYISNEGKTGIANILKVQLK